MDKEYFITHYYMWLFQIGPDLVSQETSVVASYKDPLGYPTNKDASPNYYIKRSGAMLCDRDYFTVYLPLPC